MSDRHHRQSLPVDPDDIVAAAFAAYRADAPEAFHAPPIATIVHQRAPQIRRRGFAVSVAAVACMGVVVAGIAFTQSSFAPTGDTLEAVGSDSVSDDAVSDESNETFSPSSNESSTYDDTPDPVEAELMTKTIALPAWPGPLKEQCPAGEYIFSTSDQGLPEDPNEPPIRSTPRLSGDWVLLPENTHAKSTNLDGIDGDEVIVPVSCGDVPGVIALSQEEGTFTSVAFVHAEQQPSAPIQVTAADEAVVTLGFAEGTEPAPKLRQFTYNGESFTETTDNPRPPITTPTPSEPSESDSPDDDDGETPTTEPTSDSSQTPLPDEQTPTSEPPSSDRGELPERLYAE